MPKVDMFNNQQSLTASKNFKWLKKEYCIKNKEITDATGISQSVLERLNALKSGQCFPVEVATKIAAFFDIKINTFVNQEFTKRNESEKSKGTA